MSIPHSIRRVLITLTTLQKMPYSKVAKEKSGSVAKALIPKCIQNSKDGKGVNISVHAIPNSKTDGVRSISEESVVVAISSPPVDGEANENLIETISQTLGVRRRDVSILRGERGREKVVNVVGLTKEQVYDPISKAIESEK
eukprot:TRINITY_DN2672_c0_g4_i2.p1 TRINITY_DN2672_c0_g4~~TRINITY_DN2672_c0_g4_i2.p1  ORF type:complete len:142 (+),score=26.76 TRINITY_DN2672_c0_g4_i2:117-542(+)